MALELSELQAMTDVYYADRNVTDIYFKSNILLYKLLGGEMGSNLIDGGKKIGVPLEYGELPSQSFDAGTSFKTEKREVMNMAYFAWAAYQSTIVYDLDDNRQNSGESQIVDVVETKIRNAQKTIRKNMGTALYSSAVKVGKDMLGLGDLFNTDAAVKYGEIATNDMAEWKANVSTTNEAISFAVMQKIRRLGSIDDDDEGKPNLYITTEVLKDAFEASLHQNARYSNAKLVEAGFDNILFGGRPVINDNKVGDGRCYGLNLNFLDIKTHKDYNFPKPKWGYDIKTPETMVAYIKWSGNLVCKNRKAQALHTNLTAA